MRKSWMKRLTAVFLSLGMILAPSCGELGMVLADEVAAAVEKGILPLADQDGVNVASSSAPQEDEDKYVAKVVNSKGKLRKEFTTLEDTKDTQGKKVQGAFSYATNTDTIVLLKDVEVPATLACPVQKERKINLNEHTITFRKTINSKGEDVYNHFFIHGGKLYLTGIGTVREGDSEDECNLAPVVVGGAGRSSYVKFPTIVEIGENVTLEGANGLLVTYISGQNYGIDVTVNGKLEGIRDKDGAPGAGLNVNGQINLTEEYYPQITIGDTAEIHGEGHGMYLAGCASTTINEGAIVTGENTGIEIRAGKLTINGGQITGNGDPTSSAGNGSGSTASGAGLAISQHSTMKPITVTINEGAMISGNTPLFHTNPEDIAKDYIDGKIEIKVNGGTFEATGSGNDSVLRDKNVDEVFTDVSEPKTILLSGGTYKSINVPDKKYIVPKYAAYEIEEGVYKVEPLEVKLDQDTLSMIPGGTAELTPTKFPYEGLREGATEGTPVWTSSDETVATVDENGVVTALKAGTATITLSSTINEGSATATCEVTVKEPKITLSTTEATLNPGKTVELTAKTVPADLGVTWSSSDETIATVDENGVVTAKDKTGTVTITALLSSGQKAICTVTVKEPDPEPSVTLSKTEVTLNPGKTVALTAEVVPADAKITWISSDETIATVDENGVVTAKDKIGTVTITALLPGGQKATCTIIVEEPAPEPTVTLSKTEAALSSGETVVLKAETVPASQSVTWTSSDETIATVDKNGVVTAKDKAGTVTITALLPGGQKAVCVITVKEGEGIGDVSVGAGKMEIAADVEQKALENTSIPEGVEEAKAKELIDAVMDEVSGKGAEATESLAQAAEGVKEELNGGESAVITLKTELTGLQTEIVLKGENKEPVAVPVKIVYDVDAFRQIYDMDGNKIGNEEKVGNDKLSGKSFTIRLPLPSSIDKKYAKVVHIDDKGGKDTYHRPVMESNGKKYVEVTIRHFSTFEITFEDSIPSSGGSHSGGNSGSSYTYRQVDTGKTGEWIKNDIGWWFRYSDGTWPAGCWVELMWNNSKDWYYFNADGYMVSGWHMDDGRWYYLHPYADGTQGYMYTGWHEIGGKWYYFSTVTGGPKGAMAASVITPDGYRVGADGAWIQ